LRQEAPGCVSLDLAVAAVEMRQPAVARAVPIITGVVILISGALQLTSWKLHHLACCREEAMHDGMLPADPRTAWRHGLRLGLHCSYCCANLTDILLVIGVMDLRAMAVMTVAFGVDRLAADGESVARAIGAGVVAGLFLHLNFAGRSCRRGQECRTRHTALQKHCKRSAQMS
jgi:predicted metal-binding membrane protein